MPKIGTGRACALIPPWEGQCAQVSLYCLAEVSVSNALCVPVWVYTFICVLPRGEGS